MRISINDKELTGSELFSLVWRGWFFAILAILIPAILIAGFMAFLPGTNIGISELFISILLVPVIAAGQGVLAGCIVLFGLLIKPTKRRD